MTVPATPPSTPPTNTSVPQPSEIVTPPLPNTPTTTPVAAALASVPATAKPTQSTSPATVPTYAPPKTTSPAPSTPAKPATPATPAAPVQGQPPVSAPVQQPLFSIAPLGQAKKKRNLNALFYGKFGTGKTTLVGSAVDVPYMRDVLVISAEGGEMSMEDNPRIKYGELVDVLQVRSFTQLNAIRDYLAAHCMFRDKGEAGEADLWRLQKMVFAGSEGAEEGARLRKFRTVIIDSLTEINDLCIAQLLGMHSGMNLNQDPPTAEFKEYKQNYTKMNMFIRMFRDLPMHVLMTAAVAWEKDEQQKFHYTPAMTGKLSSQIQGVFDIVGFLISASATETSAAPRKLFLQPMGGFFDAKCRIASCSKPFFDDPSMAMIMKETGLGR